MEETELRTRLESLASHAAPPPRTIDDPTATVVELHRAGRRRQMAFGAVVAAVVAVLVPIPVTRGLLSSEPDPASPATPSGAVYTTPTRGSLADEPDFLQAMLRRPRTTESSDVDVPVPPLDTRRVVFAGERGGATWVLVAGADPSALPLDERCGRHRSRRARLRGDRVVSPVRSTRCPRR